MSNLMAEMDVLSSGAIPIEANESTKEILKTLPVFGSRQSSRTPRNRVHEPSTSDPPHIPIQTRNASQHGQPAPPHTVDDFTKEFIVDNLANSETLKATRKERPPRPNRPNRRENTTVLGNEGLDDQLIPGGFLAAASTIKITGVFVDDSDQTRDDSPEFSNLHKMKELVKSAMKDTDGFSILTLEFYNGQKRKMEEYITLIASLQNKIQMEDKVRQASVNIFANEVDSKQNNDAKKQLDVTSRNMDNIAKKIWITTTKLMDTERSVMKHLPAILKWNLENFSVANSSPGTNRKQDLLLQSAEHRIRELDIQVDMLTKKQHYVKSTVTADSGYSDSGDSNKLKLQIAKLQADCANIRDELFISKDSNSQLKYSLNQCEVQVGEKDRIISELKSDLEESTARYEMSKKSAIDAGYKMLESKCKDVELQLFKQIQNVKHKEAEILNLQSKIQSLDTDIKKWEIANTEQTLKAKTSRDAEREIRKLERTITDHEENIEDLQASITKLKAESVALGKTNKLEMEKIEVNYAETLESIKAKNVVDLERSERMLKRRYESELRTNQSEITKVKGELEITTEAAKGIEAQLEDLKFIHNDEITTLHKTMDAEKKSLSEEIIKMRETVSIAESTLLESKQSYFSQRERTQEKIEELEENLRTLRATETERLNTFLAKKKESETMIDELEKKLNASEQDRDTTTLELVKMKQRLADFQLKSDECLTQLQKSSDEAIKELKEALQIAKEAYDKSKKSESEAASRIANLDSYMATLQAQVESEKKKGRETVCDLQEVQAETQEQISRVQKILEDARRDSEQYRSMVGERDDTIMDLKRQIRQKESQYASNIAEKSGASTKRLLDQKNKDIEIARQETRAALTKIVELGAKIEQQERNIEDAKTEMKRRANICAEDSLHEVDRLQMMVMELKTTRNDMMEKLDDAEHAQESLKREFTSLKLRLSELNE